jgi:secretory phospholipase A2
MRECYWRVHADNYLSTPCNEALLECLGNLRESTDTFDGNKCMIDEVIDVISLVIEAAVVAGRVLHKP